MTKVKYTFVDQNNDSPCRYRGEGYYCIRDIIFIENGSALYYCSSNLSVCASRYDFRHEELLRAENYHKSLRVRVK